MDLMVRTVSRKRSMLGPLFAALSRCSAVSRPSGLQRSELGWRALETYRSGTPAGSETRAERVTSSYFRFITNSHSSSAKTKKPLHCPGLSFLMTASPCAIFGWPRNSR